MKLICSFVIPVLLLVLLTARASRTEAADKLDAGIIVEGSDEKQNGEITLKFSYKVEYEGEALTCSSEFSLMNGGDSQVGIAYVIEFLDSELKQAGFWRNGTAGRCDDLNKDRNKEELSNKVVLPTAAEIFREKTVYAAMRILLEKDAKEAPGAQFPDWTKSTEISTALKDLKVGDTKNFEDWQFKKIK